MNKNFFLCLLFVGLFPFIVSGLETQVMSISDCVNLDVELMNTTLPVDEGEYSFKDCTQNASLWICNCDGTYNLILLTNLTTLNTYDFRINYTTKYTTQSTRRGSGGSSWRPLNITNITNTTPVYIYTSNYTNTTNTTILINNITGVTSLNLTNPIPNPAPTQPPITQPQTPQTQNNSDTSQETKKIPLILVILGTITIISLAILAVSGSFGGKPRKPIHNEPKPKINPNWRK